MSPKCEELPGVLPPNARKTKYSTTVPSTPMMLPTIRTTISAR